MNAKSARVYGFALDNFADFSLQNYKLKLDDLILAMKKGKINQYDVLSGFVQYLQKNHELVTTTLRQRVKIAKILLEYNDVDISATKFRLRIKLPKPIRRIKEALDKNDIRDIVNLCPDIRLKTYVLLLAGTGLRATEALSIRNKDINWNTNPVRVSIRGEFTKTRQDRFVFLTAEMVQQLKAWAEYKYRDRRSAFLDAKGKLQNEYINPISKPDDLVFAVYHRDFVPELQMMYYQFQNNFAHTLDRIGKGEKEDNGKRRKITLHSFRRFAKTTISDLGYADYSEWFIGHGGSTYWRKKDSEKAEIFHKIEPYLTFLDYSELEARGADIQTRLEEKAKEVSMLKQNDIVNTDAIASLSDQIMKLSAKVRELEKDRA
jgi:integrase